MKLCFDEAEIQNFGNNESLFTLQDRIEVIDKQSQYGALWKREELILAFGLYCRIPFKKTKANNPAVIEVSRLLGRSPASVARKLGNFGSFDPELHKRQIKGLVHAGKLDRQIWEEFHNDWNRLVLEESRLRNDLGLEMELTEELDENILQPLGPSEKEATIRTRIHQTFFRTAVLSSYDDTCCVTGLRIPECLIASHIRPWSTSEKFRTDPRNGLCLSATFDRLFDAGLITISHDLCIIVANRLRSLDEKRVTELISVFHGAPLIRPRRFLPLPEHLEWHRNEIFRD
jgi:putative restriction endonuclease